MVDGFTTARVIKRLSPLTLSVRAALVAKVLDTTLNIKFVSDLRQVGSFLRVLRNIVQSGVKCHKPNHNLTHYIESWNMI